MHRIALRFPVCVLSFASLVGCAAETSAPAEGGAASTDGALARAPRIVVDNPNDSTTGTCKMGGTAHGRCDLRAAFALAQTARGPVSIALAVDPVISLGQIEVAPGNGQSSIDVTLAATRAPRTIASPTGTTRLFFVRANANLTLDKVIVRNFGVYDQRGGGAILSEGTVVLHETIFRNNAATFFGIGAQTAFATSTGGAIVSSGKLVVGDGSRFENNSVTVAAQTASFTNASASGGAITSTGTLVLEGSVAFVANVATAKATSGYHPLPSGAFASASGGAVVNFGGTLDATRTTPGGCLFEVNGADVMASAPDTGHGTPMISKSGHGGAIASTGGTVNLPEGACTFVRNTALEDADVSITPNF